MNIVCVYIGIHRYNDANKALLCFRPSCPQTTRWCSPTPPSIASCASSSISTAATSSASSNSWSTSGLRPAARGVSGSLLPSVVFMYQSKFIRNCRLFPREICLPSSGLCESALGYIVRCHSILAKELCDNIQLCQHLQSNFLVLCSFGQRKVIPPSYRRTSTDDVR